MDSSEVSGLCGCGKKSVNQKNFPTNNRHTGTHWLCIAFPCASNADSKLYEIAVLGTAAGQPIASRGVAKMRFECNDKVRPKRALCVCTGLMNVDCCVAAVEKPGENRMRTQNCAHSRPTDQPSVRPPVRPSANQVWHDLCGQQTRTRSTMRNAKLANGV